LRVLWRGKVTNLKTVWLGERAVNMIDQRLLPDILQIHRADSVEKVANAIENMTVRGAPAIGAAAAYGIGLAQIKGEDIKKSRDRLMRTRPTGHDLFHALNLMMDSWRSGKDLVKASRSYAAGLERSCLSIGKNGARLIKNGTKVLTHCNAGALATVDYGTATAPLRVARSRNKKFFVFVDETRPRMQGALLTAWELLQEGIDHAIIADSAAGHYISKGEIDLVIVGADRIAANGDTANKIGTYTVAVLAAENGVPFYVATPISTIDFTAASGKDIPIEERDEEEVLSFHGVRVAPKGSKALNPAFDVTPARYITGMITEKGIVSPHDIRKLRQRNR
jgi:S-methyl-5-thioribose-1-phosphate isomerase